MYISLRYLITETAVVLFFLLSTSPGALAQHSGIDSPEMLRLRSSAVLDARRVVEGWKSQHSGSSPIAESLDAVSGYIDGPVFIGLAEAFPVDWFVHREIVAPLLNAKLVPNNVTGFKRDDTSEATLIVVVTYSQDHDPSRNSTASIADARSLKRLACTGPFFADDGPILGKPAVIGSPRVVILRQFGESRSFSSVSVVMSSRVSRDDSALSYQLLVFEEYRFSMSAAGPLRHWELVNEHFYVTPERTSEIAPDK